MALKVAQVTSPSVIQAGSPSATYTLPAGIVSTDWLVVHAGISTPASWPAGVDSIQLNTNRPGATITKAIPEIATGNLASVVWVVTGVQAGDDLWTTGVAGQRQVTVFPFENEVFVGAAQPRTPASRTTTINGPAAPTTGRTQYSFAIDRTSSTGLPTYAHSGSLTVTQDFFYDRGDAAVDPAISLWVGHTDWTAGATGAVSVTYSASSSVTSNAVGFYVEEAGVTTPVTPTISLLWPNSMEATAIRAGFIVADATTTKLAVSTSSDMASPVLSAGVTTTDGLWHSDRVTGLTAGTDYYVQLECDGVLAGDVMAVKTLAPGAPRNFTFLTGSCQNTGSNHAVFDRMALESADFFIHQGDLHYADTNVEATWRAAFLSSMNAAKFKAMRSKWAMDYIYDNHDWAGQGFEADDWDPTTNPRSMVKELAGEHPLAGSLYKTWAHGRVRFFHTDLWSERDDDALAESPTKRCMSQAQEDQFLADLTAAQEPVLVWVAHWPLYTNLAGGRWGSYTTQRDRIKAWLAARPGIRNRMVAIGGDSHSVSSDSGANQTAFGPIPTLNASPFNASGAAPSGTWDIVNYDVPDTAGVYSRVSVTDDSRSITLLWEAVDDTGAVVSTASWTRKVGTPTVWDGAAEVPATVSVWDGTAEAPASLELV